MLLAAKLDLRKSVIRPHPRHHGRRRCLLTTRGREQTGDFQSRCSRPLRSTCGVTNYLEAMVSAPCHHPVIVANRHILSRARPRSPGANDQPPQTGRPPRSRTRPCLEHALQIHDSRDIAETETDVAKRPNVPRRRAARSKRPPKRPVTDTSFASLLPHTDLHT